MMVAVNGSDARRVPHRVQRLTKANVDQVSKGMAKKQVESILGPPTAVDTNDLLLEENDLHLQTGERTVTIVF